MPLNPQELCVAVFIRGLSQLKHMLEKAQAHSATSGSDAQELLSAKLAADMHDLAAQVYWAAQGAAIAVARLQGVAPPSAAAEAKTLPELYTQLDATLVSLRGVPASELEAGLERKIEIKHQTGSMTFTGVQFLLEFAIPSFYFHMTTAYAILRHNGVELTKGDFLGSIRLRQQRARVLTASLELSIGADDAGAQIELADLTWTKGSVEEGDLIELAEQGRHCTA